MLRNMVFNIKVFILNIYLYFYRSPELLFYNPISSGDVDGLTKILTMIEATSFGKKHKDVILSCSFDTTIYNNNNCPIIHLPVMYYSEQTAALLKTLHGYGFSLMVYDGFGNSLINKLFNVPINNQEEVGWFLDSLEVVCCFGNNIKMQAIPMDLFKNPYLISFIISGNGSIHDRCLKLFCKNFKIFDKNEYGVSFMDILIDCPNSNKICVQMLKEFYGNDKELCVLDEVGQIKNPFNNKTLKSDLVMSEVAEYIMSQYEKALLSKDIVNLHKKKINKI